MVMENGAVQALGEETWASLFDAEGKISNEYGVRKIAFQKVCGGGEKGRREKEGGRGGWEGGEGGWEE